MGKDSRPYYGNPGLGKKLESLRDPKAILNGYETRDLIFGDSGFSFDSNVDYMHFLNAFIPPPLHFHRNSDDSFIGWFFSVGAKFARGYVPNVGISSQSLFENLRNIPEGTSADSGRPSDGGRDLVRAITLGSCGMVWNSGTVTPRGFDLPPFHDLRLNPILQGRGLSIDSSMETRWTMISTPFEIPFDIIPGVKNYPAERLIKKGDVVLMHRGFDWFYSPEYSANANHWTRRKASYQSENSDRFRRSFKMSAYGSLIKTTFLQTLEMASPIKAYSFPGSSFAVVPRFEFCFDDERSRIETASRNNEPRAVSAFYVFAANNGELKARDDLFRLWNAVKLNEIETRGLGYCRREIVKGAEFCFARFETDDPEAAELIQGVNKFGECSQAVADKCFDLFPDAQYLFDQNTGANASGINGFESEIERNFYYLVFGRHSLPMVIC